MLDFVPDVRGCEILRKSLQAIFNHFFFGLIKLAVPLDEGFFEGFGWERVEVFMDDLFTLRGYIDNIEFTTLESLADFLESTKIGGEILE